MERYIDDRETAGRNAQKMRWQWVPLKPHFEHLQPADVETPIIVEGKERTICHKYAVEREAAGIRRDTIHSELSLLRTAINWAFKKRLIKQKFYVWVPPPGKPRRTALTPEQLLNLLGAMVEAPLHTRLLILIALATGARRQAILDLTWDRVDFEHRTIDFRTPDERSILDTSHKKGRAIVDMSDALYSALMYAKQFAKTKYVIEYRGRPVKDPREGVKAVFEKAGLKGKFLGLHALRHTLATAAAAAGIDMQKIQRMLGHEDINTTAQVYTEFQRGALRDVTRVVDAHIGLLSSDQNGFKSRL